MDVAEKLDATRKERAAAGTDDSAEMGHAGAINSVDSGAAEETVAVVLFRQSLVAVNSVGDEGG
jgi:hypothetical protein